MDRRTVFRCMAVTDCNALPRVSRVTVVPSALLAAVLSFPLGGCSFDLGSWGSDKPQAAEQKPTGTIGGKTKEAVSDLDEAVQADPNSASAWSARGAVYERLGDKAKAFTSYGRALALRPRDETARSGLARTSS